MKSLKVFAIVAPGEPLPNEVNNLQVSEVRFPDDSHTGSFKKSVNRLVGCDVAIVTDLATEIYSFAHLKGRKDGSMLKLVVIAQMCGIPVIHASKLNEYVCTINDPKN